MKKLFTFFSLLSLVVGLSAQEFVALTVGGGTDTMDVQHAATAVVDIDDDGTLDILISGDGMGKVAEAIFFSNGDKTFSQYTDINVITPGFLACMDHGDIDADGDIDFIFNGWLPGGSTNTNGIALNDGTGEFTLDETLEIGQVAPTSGFADLNNDALMDYYFFGNGSGSCAIYFQNADGTFTKDNTSFASYDFVDPYATVIDFNNDGYLDIFLTCGWENNISGRFSAVFINDLFGGFAAMEQPNMIEKGYGSATWYDVDADGNLDLLLNGDGGADGEASSDIYRLYKNNNGVLEEAATFSEYRQISVGGGARFADFDNDGDADIVLAGWSNSEGRQATIIMECTDAANFTYVRHSWSDSDQVPGVSESDLEVGDFNDDHKIDIVLSGFSGLFGRRVAGVIFNDMATANTLPGVPSTLQEGNIEGGGFLFSWDAGTDGETPAAALTYSLYLKDVTNGKWLFNPEADLATGKRKVTGLGNVDNSLSWPLYDLPDGDYEWSVQSVDGAYEGSAFPTPRAFTIADGLIQTSSVGTVGAPAAKIYGAEGMLNIELPAQPVDAEVSIFTIDGRLVQSNALNTTRYTVELNDGIYVVRLNNNGEVRSEKIVIL
jgi:hypothetical protein